MALALAVRDELRDTRTVSRAARAGALVGGLRPDHAQTAARRSGRRARLRSGVHLLLPQHGDGDRAGDFPGRRELRAAPCRPSSPASATVRCGAPARAAGMQAAMPAARGRSLLGLCGAPGRVPQAHLVCCRRLPDRVRGQARQHSHPPLRPGGLRVLRRGADNGHAAVERAAGRRLRAVGRAARRPG